MVRFTAFCIVRRHFYFCFIPTTCYYNSQFTRWQ